MGEDDNEKGQHTGAGSARDGHQSQGSHGTYWPEDLGGGPLQGAQDDLDDEWEGEAEPLDQPAPLGFYANPPTHRPYNQRTDDTWEAIRTDYLAGDPAQVVADRYGVGLSTLRLRAAREHWRRRDQPDPEPFILDEDAPAPDLETMARHALARMDHAIKKGRPAEAASWMRTWRALTPTWTAPPPTQSPAPKREDTCTAITRLSREIESIAKDAAAHIDTLTPADQARIDARLSALFAQLDALKTD